MLLFLIGLAASSYPVVAAGNYFSMEDGTFFSHTDITKPLGNCAIITNSVFLFCQCDNSNGGAILFSNSALNSSLYIANCVYQHCTTTQDGGAIYARAMDIKILTTCAADHCASGGDGLVFLLEQVKGRADVNSTSIVDAGADGATGDAPLYVRTTTCVISGVNNTKGGAASGTGFLKIGSTYVSVGHTTCAGVSGEFAFALLWSPSLCEISRLNVVENAASSGLVFFNGEWSFDEVIFAGNGLKYGVAGSSSSKLAFKKCVFDVQLETNPQITFDGCEFSKTTATYDFEFLETALCHAVHTCTPAPTTEGPTVEPSDENVWKSKSVIGGLVGGFVCSLFLGIFLGVLYVRHNNRQANDGVSLLSAPNFRYTTD